MAKRKTIDDAQPSPQSKAAKFNAHAVKKLQAALSNDPEIDLATQLPIHYSARLKTMKESGITMGQLYTYTMTSMTSDISRRSCMRLMEDTYTIASSVALHSSSNQKRKDFTNVQKSSWIFRWIRSVVYPPSWSLASASACPPADN